LVDAQQRIACLTEQLESASAALEQHVKARDQQLDDGICSQALRAQLCAKEEELQGQTVQVGSDV
jgi:hypothetical protein